MEKNLFCTKCGTKLMESASFCHICGTAVVVEESHSKNEMPIAEANRNYSHDETKSDTDTNFTLEEFRTLVMLSIKNGETCQTYRKGLSDRWDYNAVAGILIGSKSRHASGGKQMMEKNIGIGQGDNGDHVTLKLREKGLEDIFYKYEKTPNVKLFDVEKDILSIAPEYQNIVSFINELFLESSTVNSSEITQKSQPEKTIVRENSGMSVESFNEQTNENKTKIEEKNTRDKSVEKEEIENEIVDSVLDAISLDLDAEVTGDNSVKEKEAKRIYDSIKKNLELLGMNAAETESFNGRTIGEGLSKIRLFEQLISKNSRLYGFLTDFKIIRDRVHLPSVVVNLKLCIDFLQQLSDLGYTKASYILSRCYGSGVIGVSDVDDDKTSYIIEADEGKRFDYLQKAINQDACLLETGLQYGCLLLQQSKMQEAENLFEVLSRLGIDEAGIYLKYIERWQNRVEAYDSYRAFGVHQSGVWNGQRLMGNIIEYKGWLYYYGPQTIKEQGSWKGYEKTDRNVFMKYNIENDDCRVLLEAPEKTFSGATLNSNCCLDNGIAFSIHNDKIYFSDENNQISCMDLNGNDRQVFIKGKNLDMPIAFSKHIFYRRNGKRLYCYNLTNGSNQEICDAQNVIGISDKEVLLNTGKTIRILNLETLEKQSIQNVYVGLKKTKPENLLYVDMSLEIAYYMEDKGSYLKNRIVGINKEGEIVDVWQLPKMPQKKFSDIVSHQYGGDYSSICFNGRELSLKEAPQDHVDLAKQYPTWGNCMSQDKQLQQAAFACNFDRLGYRSVFREKTGVMKGGHTFGAYHAMTNDFAIFLEYIPTGENQGCYWITASSMKTGKMIVLEFFT